MHSIPADVLDPAEPGHRDALRAWLGVQRRLALRPGEAVAALRERPDPGPLLARASGLACAAADLDDALRALARSGARLVPYPSPAYPAALRRLADAAPVLAVRGDVATLAAPCVAIVGARAATAYGREMAQRLAAGLAVAGVVVVSGLARGIDAAAHEAALAAGGRTVAFQACGPDRVYPAAHRRLADRIAACGAIASELAPGSAPLKAHFPLRNRLISGVSRAVVVVEARQRSGSLVTARHALDQGIDVLAVPGPVTSPTSEGTNGLLRDGAAPALAADDVLATIGVAPPVLPRAEDRAPDGAGPAAASGDAARIVAALHERASTRDELGRRLGLAPGALAAALLPLELDGRVVEDRDGRLRVVRAAAGRGLSSAP
ncbi:MAG TPA: DNA-processing protein DprA [Myxococcota bacterium]|nr:DNA-processing protein DprA [Myxococcota bacterium]